MPKSPASAFRSAPPVNASRRQATTSYSHSEHPSPRRKVKMRPYCGPLKILNGRGASRSASPPERSADTDLSAELKKRIQFLYAAHITTMGVDYQGMKNSPEFAAYVEQTRLLPTLNLPTTLPDDAHKIAFFVNLYNALTQHAIVAVGAPPASSVWRLFFAMLVGYVVGPYRLSLNDIENGILRGNRAVSVLPRPFGRSDARKELCVEEIDPRIHFVLNCAANSCPPILFLTAENLERSLTTATVGFLKNKDNFRVEGRKIKLSRIFDWYSADFGGSEKGILEFVAKNGDQGQQEVKDVGKLAEEGNFKLEWLPYDWSLNSQ